MFSLLTGYSDPPDGVTVKGNLHYNRYFPGGLIAMARALYPDVVEYEDGTPATSSQMAKDVVTFLTWSAEPEHDERKLMGAKAMGLLLGLTGAVFYLYRYKWAPVRNAVLVYNPPWKRASKK